MRTGGGQGLGCPGDSRGAAAWRVLSDAPQDGPWNMAVDEAIARSVGTGQAPPTIRFYAWHQIGRAHV